jgi:uncharacterized protein YegL
MNENNAIGQLNQGLQDFKTKTMQDETTRDRLELAIVTFNSNVEVVMDPTLISEAEMPTLKASGQTQIVKAIEKAQEIVEQRKSYYKSKGLTYYRPWIVVMTDGDPYPTGQDVDGIAMKIKADSTGKKYVFFIIGIGDAVNDDVLAKLATPQFPAARMDAVNFAEFFQWLSKSADVVVSGNGENSDVTLPTPHWANKGFVIGTDTD